MPSRSSLRRTTGDNRISRRAWRGLGWECHTARVMSLAPIREVRLLQHCDCLAGSGVACCLVHRFADFSPCRPMAVRVVHCRSGWTDSSGVLGPLSCFDDQRLECVFHPRGLHPRSRGPWWLDTGSIAVCVGVLADRRIMFRFCIAAGCGHQLAQRLVSPRVVVANDCGKIATFAASGRLAQVLGLMDSYSQQWADYRRRNRIATLLLVPGFIVPLLVALLLRAFSAGPAIFFLAPPFAVWCAIWGYFAFRVVRFPCPRCGTQFQSARECGNCGLRLYAQA